MRFALDCGCVYRPALGVVALCRPHRDGVANDTAGEVYSELRSQLRVHLAAMLASLPVFRPGDPLRGSAAKVAELLSLHVAAFGTESAAFPCLVDGQEYRVDVWRIRKNSEDETEREAV